jgi:hypothetical protein
MTSSLLSFALVVLLIAAIQPRQALSSQEQEGAGLYRGNYIALKWLHGNGPGVLKFDPQLRYIATGTRRGLQLWTLSTDLAEAELSYEFDTKRSREVIGGVATKGGFVFIVDQPYPDGDELAGYKLLMWSPERKELKRLQWGDEFGKNVFTNPDGTELARFRTRYQTDTSNSVALVEIYNLDGQQTKVLTVKLDETPTGIFPPIIMDRLHNLYVAKQNCEQTRRVLAVLCSNSRAYEILSDGRELLLEKFQAVGQPQRPIPLLLNDGTSVATYVRDESSGGRYRIEYYRECKLLKAANDPVAEDASDARLAITGDGKGVVTQAVSGEKKGLVKVWDIETRKVSEIATLPPITHIFPWVQGKYAPIWSSSDGQTYQGGLLEITRASD